MFQYIVQRQATLNRICLALNLKLELESSREQMLRDWENIDLVTILNELSFTMDIENLPRSVYDRNIISTRKFQN